MEIRSNSISFGSKILPNETLKTSINYIKKGVVPSGNFVKSLDSLLNDGKKDIIEITQKQEKGKRPAIVAKVNNKEIISCGYNENENIDKVRSVRYCILELAAKRNPKLALKNMTNYEQKIISSALEDLNNQIITKKINDIKKIPQILDETKIKIQEQLAKLTTDRLDELQLKIFGLK
jgi:hypothetical protein